MPFDPLARHTGNHRKPRQAEPLYSTVEEDRGSAWPQLGWLETCPYSPVLLLPLSVGASVPIFARSFSHPFSSAFCCSSQAFHSQKYRTHDYDYFHPSLSPNLSLPSAPMLDGEGWSRRKKTTARLRRFELPRVYVVPLLDGARLSPRP